MVWPSELFCMVDMMLNMNPRRWLRHSVQAAKEMEG